MIIIGTIAALGSASLFPLMFLMYGKVAGTFVDINRYKQISSLNQSSTATSHWWELIKNLILII